MIDFFELGGNVSGFGIESGEINCLSGNDLVKIADGAMVLQKTVFEKSIIKNRLLFHFLTYIGFYSR